MDNKILYAVVILIQLVQAGLIKNELKLAYLRHLWNTAFFEKEAIPYRRINFPKVKCL